MTTPQTSPVTRSRVPVRVLQGLAFVWVVIGLSVMAAGNPSQAKGYIWAAGFAVLLAVKIGLDVRSRR